MTFLASTSRGSERGVALIATLVVLVLLTIMVVAFVSVTSRDRSATASYAQSLRADQIALGGLDQVVAQLQAEITDSADNASVNGSGANAIYVPDNTHAVPQRMVDDSVAPIVTVSGSNVYGTVSDLSSPGTLSANVSLNNRSISLTRWNKPQLLTPSATTFPVPNWVIVTRGGPQTFAAGATPAGANLTISNLNNMSQAVGRFAYVVYDTSGLIDITSAGYPSSLASSAGLKGQLPWADLTQLTNAVQAADIDNLVAWRNPANLTNYAGYITNTWSTNGFMRVAPGDTTFLSRQDLIKYAQMQNVDLAAALPYLTTFSREVNGPTWQPTTPSGSSIDYTAQRYTANALNPAIFSPRVQTAFTRANGTSATAGEPLVKYRFPLDKLALLEKQGLSTLSTQDKADILKYFGLVLATDSSGLYRHWIYTNPAGNASTTGVSTILTLDQVAALNPAREPDFFELLQAGILNGSLGKVGRADDITHTWTDPDSNTTYQIIRIGANIIDQWDADSYPTTITYDGSDFYGIEDLPYFNEVFARANGSPARTDAMTNAGVPANLPSYPPYTCYLYFEMWNPHQVSTTSAYPAGFQIAPLQVAQTVNTDYMRLGIATSNGLWYWNGSSWSLLSSTIALSSLANGGKVPIGVGPAATSYQNSYREPALASSGSALWSGGPSIAGYSFGTINDYPPAGTLDVDWAGSTNTAVPFAPANLLRTSVALIFHAVLELQYQDSSGNWHTYSTFEGIANPTLGGANASTTANAYYDVVLVTPQLADTSVDTDSFAKSDPRTYRFGPGQQFPGPGATSFAASAGVGLTPNATTLTSPIWGGNLNAPFLGQASGLLTAAAPYRLDMWAVNDSAVTPGSPAYTGSPTPNRANTAAPYYLDNDGVMRIGDARYSYAASTPASPLFTGATANRPIMLNRPFTSVGDLGFAFRDEPWKTLDLFSANSADAGLLDIFTLGDASAAVVAGRVNPNTAPAPVLQALLAGTWANVSSGNTTLGASSAGTIATALATAVGTSPLANRGQLVSSGFLTNSAVASFSDIKTEREAVVRALAESANTRTWNFLIDIIAQSGSYPKTATTLDNFLVTGERRYWLHVAIDRYTGQVVDKQLEVVNE